MEIPIPASLASACQDAPETVEWLKKLPALIKDVKKKWQLDLGEPLL